MKRLFIIFLISSILLCFGWYSFSQELPILAVVAFENHSEVQIPDLENMGLQYLESALLSYGRFTLADRLSVQKSLTEIGFSAASGLVDPSYSIQLGKMLGARYLVTGNVVDVSCKTTEFKGYGIKTQRTAVSVTVGIRVVDSERGTVFFIDQESAWRENLPAESFSVKITESSLSTVNNLIQEAIRKCVDRFVQTVVAHAPKPPTPIKKVKILVDSDPTGADVEIGGLFYGNTPCELFLEEGRIVEISVSLSGFTPWIKKVEVNPSLKIMAKLKELSSTDELSTTTESPANVDVNVKIETKQSEGDQ